MMQFSWAESPEGDGSDAKGGDLTTYENLYGNELQLFESFFNGNLNELDYLSDLTIPEGSDALQTAELQTLPIESMLFVKNEPSSPQSFTESASPSSPGESSGPSSPETLYTVSTETINPVSLGLPSGFAPDPLLEAKKQGSKRTRVAGQEEDEPTTPTNATPDEDRQIKRQRRLIKNRESAQKSRMRKKMYIEDMETKVKSLTSHNEALMHENCALKEEINFLTKFINKTPGLAEEIAHSRPKGTVTPIRNVKAAGVCLLIVLFSFGLFFNNVQQFADNGPALPFEGGAREPIPEVLPFGGERRYGRMLKSFKDAVPSLSGVTEEVGGDLTQIYPKRRLPPADAGPLESVIQRNKKVGTGLSPYKKIKLEEDSTMDVIDPAGTEELAKGFIPQLPATDGLLPDASVQISHQGQRNDTGAETTGHTDN